MGLRSLTGVAGGADACDAISYIRAIAIEPIFPHLFRFTFLAKPSLLLWQFVDTKGRFEAHKVEGTGTPIAAEESPNPATR